MKIGDWACRLVHCVILIANCTTVYSCTIIIIYYFCIYYLLLFLRILYPSLVPRFPPPASWLPTTKQHECESMAHREADYTTGIFQSIGLKEFHDYLVLPSSEQTGDTGEKLLKQGVEALKVRTRRYARQQLKWIRKRFLQQPDRQVRFEFFSPNFLN